AREVLALIKLNDWQHMELTCLPADLHLRPEKIPDAVERAVEAARSKYEQIFVAYADCGTGGLLAARCEKLGVSRFLVPPGAGVGSAIGFLRAPFSFEANRSIYMRLSDFDSDAVRHLMDELQTEATQFVRSCDAQADIVPEFKVYMRYTGQGWEIPVILSEEQAKAPNADTFHQLFEAGYQALFGRVVTGMDVEITVWAVNATTLVPPVDRIKLADAVKVITSKDSRSVFDAALGKPVASAITHRHTLDTGDTVQGPAIIAEDETTIILPSSCRAIRQTDGCIDISVTRART
ncbi:MAG: DUF1638 domain-containing protein, partial [Rhodobacteraceae bacterium]|nr:DUF1638 domain-containing protein [Paracoccaceae bacterium]